MSRALFCFLISLLAPPKRPLQFITSDVGSFSSYSCGAGVEALFFSLHFLPTHLYKGKKKVICSPLPCSCPMKEAVDLERYALEGNAVWITIWHVWFLTYFFFFCTWPCGFPAHIFQFRVWQKNLRQLSENSILCAPAAAWTVLLMFLRSGEILADVELLPDQSKQVQGKKRNPHLWFSFVNKHMQWLLASSRIFNGFIIHSCWLQWNLG